MPSITSAGIGSGLDIESLIGKLVAVERTPINQLKTHTDGLKTQLSAYGKIQSALAAMRDAAGKLTKPDTWAASMGNSSDATAVSVSPSASAPTGNVAVMVNRLASAQSVSSKVIPVGQAVGQGTMTIELGKWTEAPPPADPNDPVPPPTFDPKAGGSPININLPAGPYQLAQVRDEINKSNAGVVASIVTDSSGPRLVIRSSETGATNGFRIKVANSDGQPDGEGLSALSYDPGTSLTPMTRNQAAGNASVLLNGLSVDSESNTLKDSIEGMTINLLKASTAEVNLTIGPDKDSIKKAINDFATAYNAVATLMGEQTKYDAATKKGAALQGDSAVVGLQFEMRGLVGATSTVGGKYSRFAEIGLNPSTGGVFKTDAGKLDAALGDLASLKTLFMGTDSNNSSNVGLAKQLQSFADKALGFDGRVTNRQSGLQKAIDNDAKSTERLETKVSLTETRLRARYTALDTQMSKLSSLSTYVTQQMNNLVK
ncbi:flagellar filament capping protein FliD [Paucibacter sp. TC2R-5]|uniref:flagellar filament capping protein FliD n=1 Tax=Paucibacter sp. TC2R-5 TaxID=2893555 RepID=UPI0021E4B10D|nr:flagellar filament capping protein FliD [Paucibacter sp. TC2R-5]MCV2359252.1 flagellar filament capping protein FliD [Paucibacter sp. TC2R-5]